MKAMKNHKILIKFATLLTIYSSCAIVLAAQQPLTAVQKKTTGDYVTQIRTDFNAELAKQQAMNTELYTSLSSAEAFISAWGWSPTDLTDLTAPGPIGSVTPSTGKFTALQAEAFDLSSPSEGETGEIGLPEDPTYGTNTITLKAPESLPADIVITLPAGVAPATAASTCTPGQWWYDSDYWYVCIGTDVWKRAPLSTW